MNRLVRFIVRRVGVTGNVSLGRDVHIGPGSRLWAPDSLKIEDDVYIGKWCTLETNGRIGTGTLIANNVGIVGRRDHDMRQVGVPIRRAKWVGDASATNLRAFADVGSDVWIGYGAVLLAPVRIGRGAVVAAGAVVVNDVSPYAVVAGSPAQQIAQRFTEAEMFEHERLLDRRAAKTEGLP